MPRIRAGAMMLLLCLLAVLFSILNSPAQSTNAGTVTGLVLDNSGAAIPGAHVALTNPLRGFTREAVTGRDGQFRFSNVPFDAYTVAAQAPRFGTEARPVQVASALPVNVRFSLKIASAETVVSVEADAATAPTLSPTAASNLDRSVIRELPTTGTGSGLADLVAMSSPSVAADSNGMFHPLGDHSESSTVVDGQPISDQQSKQFSTAIPDNALESLELVTADPSAEFGDKTSMVVQATTRSGLGANGTHGSFEANYGSFGTVGEDATLTTGSARWGNFIAGNSARSGRFLDTPELSPLHDVGNHEVVFDRVDFQPNTNNVFHVDLQGARNRFQIPNTFDQRAAGQDQRQQVVSFNVAPSYQHVFGTAALLAVQPWFRRDHIGYFPSSNLFSDQPATISQTRYLTNIGGKVNLSLTGHGQNALVGGQWMQTRLNEDFHLGLTDPLFNAVCVDINGNPIVAPGVREPNQCPSAGAGETANPGFQPGLLPLDLTRNGSLFHFQGMHNINEAAAYVQDGFTFAGVQWDLGVRADHYVGLTDYNALEPRVGGAYRLPWTGTVLRASYARSYESPYNENLILSSATGQGGLATNVFGAFAGVPLQPGKRNSFDAGLQQNLGRRFQVDGDYFWKYTTDAFDFDTLFNTPITFPITWQKSKIDGLGVRISTVRMHGFTVSTTLGHTRSRFFGPENGGIIFNSPLNAGAFRIDHDQNFQQTTSVNYRHGDLWTTLTWQYESGLVAGAVPDLASLLALDADKQQAVGFFCGSQVASLGNPITSCSVPYPQYGASRVVIPAPGTENDDTHPPRVAPRNLFDLGLGDDNVHHTEFGVITARLTITNLGNRQALYNFLSTFSGTHFVSPRAIQARLGLTF